MTSKYKVKSKMKIKDIPKREVTGKGWEVFLKDPISDLKTLRENYLHKKRGAHFYFRNMKLCMQERFVDLMDHGVMPQVFLHGSPHVDNYSRNHQGGAMVDFDRSRIGPYAWDLVRIMTSVAFRQEKSDLQLHPQVVEALKDGYVQGFQNPDEPFKEYAYVMKKKVEDSKTPVKDYLKERDKWALRILVNAIDPSDPDALSVLKGYLKQRGEEDLLSDYDLKAAGQAVGSMGRRRYLYILWPRDKKKDAIFLEIKHVRDDPDNQFYRNPFKHHGERMIQAAELYCPGWETRQGYTTHDGIEYWGHQVPPLNIKVKKSLDLDEQIDFLYSSGTQIGRAHRLSIQKGYSPEQILSHLEEHFGEMVTSAEIMRSEIEKAYGVYMDKLTNYEA